MLNTRKFEVVFVSAAAGAMTTQSSKVTSSSSAMPDTAAVPTPNHSFDFKEEWLRLPGTWIEGVKGGDAKPSDDDNNNGIASEAILKPAIGEIEEIIVEKLVEMHGEWITQSSNNVISTTTTKPQ